MFASLCVPSSNGDGDLSPQTITLLVYISGALKKNGPFLVISPLSVMENWREELERCRHTLHTLSALRPHV